MTDGPFERTDSLSSQFATPFRRGESTVWPGVGLVLATGTRLAVIVDLLGPSLSRKEGLCRQQSAIRAFQNFEYPIALGMDEKQSLLAIPSHVSKNWRLISVLAALFMRRVLFAPTRFPSIGTQVQNRSRVRFPGFTVVAIPVAANAPGWSIQEIEVPVPGSGELGGCVIQEPERILRQHPDDNQADRTSRIGLQKADTTKTDRRVRQHQ